MDLDGLKKQEVERVNYFLKVVSGKLPNGMMRGNWEPALHEYSNDDIDFYIRVIETHPQALLKFGDQSIMATTALAQYLEDGGALLEYTHLQQKLIKQQEDDELVKKERLSNITASNEAVKSNKIEIAALIISIISMIVTAVSVLKSHAS